jgi:hypothetical protein
MLHLIKQEAKKWKTDLEVFSNSALSQFFKKVFDQKIAITL